MNEHNLIKYKKKCMLTFSFVKEEKRHRHRDRNKNTHTHTQFKSNRSWFCSTNSLLRCICKIHLPFFGVWLSLLLFFSCTNNSMNMDWLLLIKQLHTHLNLIECDFHQKIIRYYFICIICLFIFNARLFSLLTLQLFKVKIQRRNSIFCVCVFGFAWFKSYVNNSEWRMYIVME